MEEPEGFDSWSEECKEAFRRLKAEYDARIAAERELAEARADAQAKENALRELREAQGRDEAELRDVQQWLDSYHRERRALEERVERELQQEYATWFAAGQRTAAEIRAKKAELRRRRNEALDAFERERDAKRARKRELETSIRQRRPQLDAAEAANDAAQGRVEAIRRRLEGMRSVAEMLEDLYALIRRCGPQDPRPGDPSIPITPRYAILEPPRLVRPRDVPAYVAFLEGPIAREAPPQQVTSRPRAQVEVVGDVIYPSDDEQDQPNAKEPGREQLIRFKSGAVWYEGCVELLWLQGTQPFLDRPDISNPITRSVEQAAGDVNTIWKRCCVRFRFFLKVVTMQQLGALANAANGITVVDESTTSASSERINQNYKQILRGLQDHPECVVFLVVDDVTDGAGFAGLGAKAGVVEVAPSIDRAGRALAHELGHALAKIDHVEDGVQHARGDLMWGKGCDGWPDRPDGERYERVQDRDCVKMKMKAATTPTIDPCELEETQ